MKEIKLYQCGICGTQYKMKNECEACEKHHVKPKRITGKKYHGKNMCSDGYPIHVTVSFEDGNTITYKR